MAVNGGAATNGITNGRKKPIPSRLYSSQSPSIDEFRLVCERSISQEQYPLCSSVQANIPIYDVSQFSSFNDKTVEDLQDEWNHVLMSGPGVFVLRNCFDDLSLIDRVNHVYESIIADEASTSRGDHFAASGKNSRIWNSFQKHAEREPSSFVTYYSNPWLACAAKAWLGPAYRMTAQVNVVRPGGQAQVAHRDYHLGFQTSDACGRFPASAQVASQLLTLQGAVAHSDMPVDSGPTRLLPFSQSYGPGYMAYRLPGFTDYFNQHWVSAPLAKGDAVFFSPALFHAAGENTTAHVIRSANLLQISSAFGKPMENINNEKIISACWDELSTRFQEGGLTMEMRTIVETISDGYPFPTNLDQRPPAPGGMAPESETDILIRGLKQRWSKNQLVETLRVYRNDSSA